MSSNHELAKPTPQTVLVIDDDAINRLMASEALSEAGYGFVEAPDAESGSRAFYAGASDFITRPIVWDLLPYRMRYALRARDGFQESCAAGHC